MKEYIGVDIGGTKIAIVKGDELGNVSKKIRFENKISPAEAVERIIKEVKALLPAEAIGVSCGGPLDAARGMILSPPNLPGWDEIPITRLLTDATGLPCFLQNDADACALAEWKFGAGRGTKNMIFLTFGTGMGAGLILDGRLYSGTNGNAGEVGHLRLRKTGPIGYGKAGSFEGFASGGGIAQLGKSAALTAHAWKKAPLYCPTKEELDTVTAQSVALAAQAGDETAIGVYETCGRMLGYGISMLIDILNPERIVIGSIFARSGELLRKSMQEIISEEALPQSSDVCEIVPAELGESLGDVAAISVAVNGMNK